MYKKITLAQASKLVKEVKANILTVVADKRKEITEQIADLSDERKPILAYSYLKDGVDMRHCYCLSCGSEYDEEDTYRYYSYYKTGKCPTCKNNELMFINRASSLKSNIRHSLVIEVNNEEKYIIFASFTPTYNYNMNHMDIEDCLSAGNYDFLKGEFEKTIPEELYYYSFSIFMLDKGLRLYDETLSTNFISPTSNTGSRKLFEFFTGRIIGDMDAVEKFFVSNGIKMESSALLTIKKAHDDIERKKKEVAAKKVKKPNTELEMYRSYKPKAINEEEAIKSVSTAFMLLKTQVGTHYTYVAYCPKCNSFHEIVLGKQSDSFTCPGCGEELDCGYHKIGKGTEISDCTMVKTIELMEETNDLLVRTFDVYQKITINEELEYKIIEKLRFFFSPKKIRIFRIQGEDEQKITKGSAYDLDAGYWSHQAKIIQSNEEIKDIIQNSTMKYTGLIEAWGLNDQPGVSNVLDCNRTSYLYQWYKKPCIEQLLKTNLITATKEVIGMDMDRLDRYVNSHETSVYTILNITKPVFKIARKLNLSLSTIKYCKNFWELDHTLTEETFVQIKNLGSMDAIYEIASNYNISFSKIIEYIDSCYNYQCIEKNEAIRIWRDYLKMARDMTYRLDNKNTKFPSSLKKEHDKAIFAYRVVEDEINKKRFTEQAEKNVRYEYSYEKLFVRVPRTPEEIIEEGTNQKHCVASYVNRVREGDTIVAFIRYKEFPNDSYFTIEIRDDVVVQVKGYTNCAPKDKDLLVFLNKFAAAKKLKLSY